MSIPIHELDRIAALARLELSAEEKKLLAGQIDEILAHAAALPRVSGGKPGVGREQHCAPLREDAVSPDPLHRDPIDAAPAREGRLFQVPGRLIAEGEAE